MPLSPRLEPSGILIPEFEERFGFLKSEHECAHSNQYMQEERTHYSEDRILD